MSENNTYSVQQFAKHEAEHYKTIRLEALQLEPGVFFSTYAREAAFIKEIGLTGIVLDKQDRDVAHMTQSYIRAAHRGRGLSRLLYDARIGWAKERGVKTLRIGHRESNLTSKSANQHYGFKYTYRESITWPDGMVEDSLYYELEIANLES